MTRALLLVLLLPGCGAPPDPWALGCEDALEFAERQDEPETANYLEAHFWMSTCGVSTDYASGFVSCWADALGADPCAP